MKSYREVCERKFELTEPENYSQIRKECHSYIYEMNLRGFITFDSQDGMSIQCHERPYVTGFLSTKLWKRFSHFLRQNPHITIVEHRIDKNTRHQRQQQSISVTQDRTYFPIKKHTWVHPLIPMDMYNFEKKILELDINEHVLLITCVDMRWCSLARNHDQCISMRHWKTNAINPIDGLFVRVNEALLFATK